MEMPSFDAFCSAFRRPPIAVEESTPFFSRFASHIVASETEKPISSKTVLLSATTVARLVAFAPVSCAALVSVSRNAPASSADMPHAAMAFWTVSTDVVTSELLRFANLTNFVERSSSSSPVTPKRVETSPTAAAAVPKSVGMLVAMSSMMDFISSSESPDAPVIFMRLSCALSTSVNAATAAAPPAMIGAVRFFVMPSPMSFIWPPTSFSLSPTACACCLKTLPNSFDWSVSFFSAASSSAICR